MTQQAQLSIRSGPGQLDVERAAEWLRKAKDTDQIREVRDQARAIETYRRQRSASLDAQNDAAEIALRAERRLGELCAEVTGGSGRPGKSRTDDVLVLSDLDITHAQSSRWQKLARIDDTAFQQHVIATRARCQKLTTAGAIAAVSHGADYDSNEWYTPEKYIAAARSVLGNIDLDPASNPIAQETVQAGHYFTKEDDGRAQEWSGRVWMNPPYSTPEVEDLTGKFVDHYEGGDIEAGIVLVNNSTDTDWCQRMFAASDAFCFTDGRIAFLTPDGTPSKQTRRGQVLFYFGADPDRFADIFCRFGLVIIPQRRAA